MAYPRIVFHHIPKCGGMSLVRGLVGTYYPSLYLLKGKQGFSGGLTVSASRVAGEIVGLDQWRLRRGLLAYQIAKGNSPLIYGHYPFSRTVFERYKASWAFITLLRHPVDRWYSEYYYNRFKSDGEGKTTLAMEAYLETDQGLGSARTFVNFLTEGDDRTRKATAGDAEAATEALGCFDVVGCLENLDAFQRATKKRFGRRLRLPHVNKSPAGSDAQRPEVDASVHRRLLDLLEADMEIYRRAQERIAAESS